MDFYLYITPPPPILLPPPRGGHPLFFGGRGDYTKKFFWEIFDFMEPPSTPRYIPSTPRYIPSNPKIYPFKPKHIFSPTPKNTIFNPKEPNIFQRTLYLISELFSELFS